MNSFALQTHSVSAMDQRWTFLLFLLCIPWSLALPLTEDGSIDKRTLEDPPTPNLKLSPLSPYLGPYGIYPGIKPLRPFPPGFFLNRFATTPPPISPISALFKSKKDEFLNALFDQLSIATDAPEIEVRSVVDEYDDSGVIDDSTVTTPKPKIDPSVFITKKFDFLAKLFEAINTTTTPAPTVEGQTVDPSVTTVKPTIVPPGFWVPIFKPPKAPKPPKATKVPKPSKTKALLLDAVDEAILKELLSELDPTNPIAAGSGKAKRKASFLDALLHRTTTPEPQIAPDTTADPKTLESRSLLFPPGYWIPPYIYAAKMGIYLDKIFDTINSAATNEDLTDGNPGKRSIDTATNASALILSELSQLKNELLTAFTEGIKAAPKVAPSAGKAPAKPFKKPFWGPKTTPMPDPVQTKIDLLSEVFDKLAEVQMSLLNGPEVLQTVTAAADGIAATTTVVPPSFWVPDPTSPDIGEYYKDKTQQFLTQLFAGKEAAPASRTS